MLLGPAQPVGYHDDILLLLLRESEPSSAQSIGPWQLVPGLQLNLYGAIHLLQRNINK